ncbi:WD40-repeat-containing domain protein [Xylaria digitata]|nr:WD40-repeat-containing domain protein [Xylaria digitata]
MLSPRTGSSLNDVELPSDGEDTIQSISWSPVTNHLAAASWDSKVRIYDVARSGSARGVSTLIAEGPVFSCDWAKDGKKVIAGGADKKIRMMDMSTGQQDIVGSHEAPVRGIRFVDVPGTTQGSIIMSGSWDKTVKFWDIRQQGAAVASLPCGERIYSLDAKAHLAVIATADLFIHLVDLKNPTTFLDKVKSPLRHQTKAVTAFPNGKGWATAGIEGRCGMNAVEEEEARDINFTFRCHREIVEPNKLIKVWTINDVQFHPVYTSTFVTAGSDGSFCFWDRVAHSRLKSYPPATPPSTAGSRNAHPSSITATSFSRDGSFYAYALGYDWSRGCAGNTPQIKTKILLHRVTEDDALPKAAGRVTNRDR